jgi:hypothetical protein
MHSVLLSFSHRPETSRRRAPRVIVRRYVGVEIPAVDIEAEAVDLSVGGFCVDTPVSLPVGEAYLFRFLLDGGQSVDIAGRVIHCRRKPTSDRTAERYLTGCEFIHDPSRPTEALIARLMDAAAEQLSLHTTDH